MIINTRHRMAKAWFFLIWASLGCAILVLSACESTNTNEAIPSDLSPAKFFLKAQEMVDSDNYDGALQYLNEFRHRFGTSTNADILDKYMEADYISAQISFKRGNLSEARAQYASLLAKYDGVAPDAASPPKWIKILCMKLIGIIDAKLNGPSPAPATASPTASPSPSPSPSPKAN